MTEQSPEYTNPTPHLTLVARPRTEAERTALIISTPWVSVMHGNVLAERDALQKLVEQLEGRVDEVGKLEFAIECYEKDLSTIAAAVPADKYPGSKDWRDGSTLERIQWLHDMYACAKEENDRLTADVLNLQAMLDAVGAGGVGPLRHHLPDATKMVGLSDARINGIYHLYKHNTSPIGFARAIIEAAHGIASTPASDQFRDATKMLPDAPSRYPAAFLFPFFAKD